ncbi:MAG: filamentous hemagglutinin N-terminal domain-containing protein, partial [Rhodocyclales bacterium]|nr:filamentous hemagglutinin N-terminal domain-containing protein [Rhodocyclales bacterium]
MFKHATLNRSYRLVWSELRSTWVAVAEFASRRGKRSCGALVAGAVLVLGNGAAAAGDPLPNALPTGGQVVAGQVGIGTSGARMDVTQSSNSAIVNWDSFNIGSQAQVNFVQPGTSSVILNRVLGGDGSAIFGRMTANGQVFVTNPGGILFAPGAQVDVGGLVASSLGISDANFLAGKYQFEKVGAGGTVSNQGTINAANGGFVALIAPQVANSGAITATRGSVGLAAGDSVNLDFDHDGLLSFQVNVATAAARADNSGVIVADGGRVVMDVRAKDALLSTVLNNDGIIRARSLESRNGEIWLGGGDSGVVSVSGTLDASGTTNGQAGGTVKVLGDKVGLFDHAGIDVSGVGAGGTVLVGGNFQGKGPEQNASATYVGKDVSINADAVGMGDGGKVIVWADDVTRFFGSISAKGGVHGGNGGFVETSGKISLIVDGVVNTLAPKGITGTWLLDPQDIEIVNAGAVNYSAGTNNLFANNPGVTTKIKASGANSISAQTSNVVLQATRDIAFTDPVSITNAGTSLTAQAGRHIDVNAGITTNGGAIRLEADSPHSSAGPADGTGTLTVANSTNIASGGGKITLIGNDVTLGTGMTIDAGAGGIDIARSQSAVIIGGGSPFISTADVQLLRTTGALVIGQATTAGSDGQGTGALARTATTLTLGANTTVNANMGASVSFVSSNGFDANNKTLTTNQTTTINADSDASGAGTATIDNTLSTTGNALTVVAATTPTISGTINTATANVTVLASTAGATFGIADATKTLNLTDAALDFITTTGTVTIGSTANTGGITIGTDGALTQDAKNFAFATAGNIAVGANNFTTTGNVGLTADNAGNTAAISSGAGVIAANTITAVADAGLALKTNATTLALTNSTSGAVSIAETNGVSISGSNTGGGAFTITTGAGATLTVNGGNINANTGAATLETDTLVLTGTVTGDGGVVLKPVTAGTIGLEDGSLGVGVLNVTNALLNNISSTGTITVGDATTT